MLSVRWSVRSVRFRPRFRPRSTLRGAAPGIALALLLGGCVVPARTDAGYRTDASMALESATSATRTAQLALQQWLQGRMPRTYANIVVTDSESSLGPIQASFGGVDPPNRKVDSLRADVGAELSDAADALAQGRIALRRSDRAGVMKAVAALGKVSSTLEKTGARVQ